MRNHTTTNTTNNPTATTNGTIIQSNTNIASRYLASIQHQNQHHPPDHNPCQPNNRNKQNANIANVKQQWKQSAASSKQPQHEDSNFKNETVLFDIETPAVLTMEEKRKLLGFFGTNNLNDNCSPALPPWNANGACVYHCIPFYNKNIQFFI